MHLSEIPGIKTNEAVFGIIINFDENIFFCRQISNSLNLLNGGVRFSRDRSW